ncbi:hypothetical protein, partial [Prevotella koreensis]
FVKHNCYANIYSIFTYFINIKSGDFGNQIGRNWFAKSPNLVGNFAQIALPRNIIQKQIEGKVGDVLVFIIENV